MSSPRSTPQLRPHRTATNTTSLASTYAPAYASPSLTASTSPCTSRRSSIALSEHPAQSLDDDIPPLTLSPLSDRVERADALHLVADSVAQMRQRAAKALIFHPLPLAGLAATVALTYRFTQSQATDAGVLLTLTCGVVMSYLAVIRYFTSDYIRLAEEISWSWLRPGPDDPLSGLRGLDEEDIILAARYGNKIIATAVLRLQPNLANTYSHGSGSSSCSNSSLGWHGGSHGRRRSRAAGLRGGKGVIRGWTTKLQYRGKGVGRDLLLAAVRMTKEKCGRDAEVGFAREHANSVMILPGMFNGPFKRDERRAARCLESVVADWEATKKRR